MISQTDVMVPAHPTLPITVNYLAELLAKSLLALSPDERQRLEAELERIAWPMGLLAVLVNSSRSASGNGTGQLAGVLLTRFLPSRLWIAMRPAEQEEFKGVLLTALSGMGSGTPMSEEIVRSLADVSSAVARCVAEHGGGVWPSLFSWMQEVGSRGDCVEAFGQSRILELRCFLHVLASVVWMRPWQELLAPHLIEILILLRHIVFNASIYSFSSARHAIRSVGTTSVTLVHGEEAARSYHQNAVLEILLHNVVLTSSELCEETLEALAQVASADELLLADASVYFLPPPNLPPTELCVVVRLALDVAVSHRSARRHSALQLLHNVADSHSELLVTSGENGKLSAAQVLNIIIMSIACDEVLLNGDSAFPLGSNPAEWGAEFAVLHCMSRRLPDRLIFPAVYQLALRAFNSDGSSALHRAVGLAALRTVLLGCTSMVKKQLHRIVRLLLRGLAEVDLHSVAFILLAELCGVVSADARCGSARLTERLLPPLLLQLQNLQVSHHAFPHAVTAFEAACASRSGKAIPFRPPQLGATAVAWLCDKIRELLAPSYGPSCGELHDTSQRDAMLARLCSLLGVLVKRQPLQQALDESGHILAARVAQTLQVTLSNRRDRASASAALEASGAWLCVAAEAGLLLQPLLNSPTTFSRWQMQQDLLTLSMQISEHGLKYGLCVSSQCREDLSLESTSQCSQQVVFTESALRFVASLSTSSGQVSCNLNDVFRIGFERCVKERDLGLLTAFGELPLRRVICTEGLSGGPPGIAWNQFVAFLLSFMQDCSLRKPAVEIAGQVQLCEETAPLLLEIARLLLAEERTDVLISLCRAAVHFVAQEGNLPILDGRPTWVTQAVDCICRAADALPQRCMNLGHTADDGAGDSDEELSESSSDSVSSGGATTVASTADLETGGAESELKCAIQSLRKALGIE